MIVLDLCCGRSHRFEGWFASSDEYARQVDAGMLSCPTCGDRTISRLPSGPHLRRSSSAAAEPEVSPDAEASKMFAALHDIAMSTVERLISASEDVGERFAEEARRIHRDESPRRNIRGVATREQARELAEEGITVVALPFPPKSDMH